MDAACEFGIDIFRQLDTGKFARDLLKAGVGAGKIGTNLHAGTQVARQALASIRSRDWESLFLGST